MSTESTDHEGLGPDLELGALAADERSTPARDPAFPRVLRPRGAAGFDALVGALTARRDALRGALSRSGALLLRGFEVATIEQFEGIFTALGIPLSQDYTAGAAARHRVGRFAFTTTELTAQVPIPPHVEMAYRRRRPPFLGFYCAVAPTVAGETPIFDSRAALADLPPDVQATLAAGDITWCQTFPRRRGLTSTSYERAWPEEFGSDDPAEVERICAAFGARCEWRGDGRLAVVSDTPAIIVHPYTGERSLTFQLPTLAPLLAELRRVRDRHGWARSALFRLLARGKAALGTYPFEARDAGGAPLPDALFLAVQAALWRNAAVFRWRAGDVLVLDNRLTHHGRLNVVGPRTIYVALGDAAA